MTIEEYRKRFDNPSLALDLLRIYLGIALFVRGAEFMSRPDILQSYIAKSEQWFVPIVIGHFVIAAHVAGGLLLALGLATRAAAIAQIPVLMGAVFLVHWKEGLLTAGQSLELSGLVLAMLAVIAVFGPGHFSVDYELERRAAERDAANSVPPLPDSTEANVHP